MTHAVAMLQLGTTAGAPVVLAATSMVGLGAVIPVAADLLATSAEDPGVVAVPAATAGATDTVAVVVSAAATGETHAPRPLRASHRATAPWRRPGRPL